jgi:hypothetical protein
MRNMVVLGVPSELQGLSENERKVPDPGYKALIETLFSRHAIDFVFEEASGILSSYAAKSASSSESFIQYLGVDPQKNDKQKYGLEGEATAPMQVDAGGAAPAPDTAKIENLELHVKREKHWLRRIQAQEFRSGLMICVPIHVLSFAARLIEAGFEVQAFEYMPYHELSNRIPDGK